MDGTFTLSLVFKVAFGEEMGEIESQVDDGEYWLMMRVEMQGQGQGQGQLGADGGGGGGGGGAGGGGGGGKRKREGKKK